MHGKEVVRLDQLSSLPEKRRLDNIPPIRLAVAAILSPAGTVESYSPLVRYMEEVTGRPVILMQRKTYGEVNEMIASGQVDLAFICTGAYFKQARHRRSMSLLVTPQIDGKNTYRAVIIVSASSSFTDIASLRGSVFAFTDPLSNTGYFHPMSLLKTMGYEPQSFFRRTFFTYSHDKAIHAVAEGLADAASVDEIVLLHALISLHGFLADLSIALLCQNWMLFTACLWNSDHWCWMTWE